MFVGEDLVYDGFPEVAVEEVSIRGAVELEDRFNTVEGEEVVAGGGASGAVGVGVAAGPAVGDVVLLLNGFGDGAAGRGKGDILLFLGFPRAAPGP